MALETRVFFPTHPGQEGAQFPHDFKFSDANINASNPRYVGGGFPDNELAKFSNFYTLLELGGGFGYASGDYSVTTTGTGAAAAAATTAGTEKGSVLLTCGSDSTFNTTIISKSPFTPTAGKRILGYALLQASDITTVGWEFGVGNTQVDPATTNFTDCVKIKMAVGAGTTVLAVRGDSGTQATQAGTTLSAATDIWVAFTCELNATATSVDGGFWMGTTFGASMTYTPFNAAQQTQAAAILTTPPSMYGILAAKGSASNPTVLFKKAWIGVEA